MALAFLRALHTFRSSLQESDVAARRGGEVRPKAPKTASKPASAAPAMTYDEKTKTMRVTAKHDRGAGGQLSNDIRIDQRGDHVTVTVQIWDDKARKEKATKFEHDQVENLDIRTGKGRDFISTSSLHYSGDEREFADPKADNNHANKNVTVNLKVDAGGGDDFVIGSNGKNTLNGGAGNDRLIGGKSSDAIDGGGGDDYIEGAAGDDRLQGGKNKDVIYGNRGDDEIIDKQGAYNYLEGGKDNDHIVSGGMRNVVSAGRGNDSVDSLGIDTIYTGAGKDKVRNLGGQKDTIYAQICEDKIDKGRFPKPTVIDVSLKVEEQVTTRKKVQVEDDGALDGLWRFLGTGGYKTVTKTSTGRELVTPGKAVEIEGSAEFKDRMEDDIDMFRSSPTGQSMLKVLDESGHAVTLREPSISFEGKASAWRKDRGSLTDVTIREDGSAGQTKDAMVIMQPSVNPNLGHRAWFPGPTALYHEFSHAYNIVTGTMQPEISERQAVGLPADDYAEGVPYDFDQRPETPPTKNSPFNLTENGLRSEMNVPLRTKY